LGNNIIFNRISYKVNNSPNIIDFVFVGLSVICQTSARVLAKQAGLFSNGNNLTSIVLNPWYGALMASFILQAFFWPLALRRLPLSIAYSFMALVFPLTIISAKIIFHEEIYNNHLFGMRLIFIGVVIISKEVHH
jgi:multidrug transporter EmrE-like cation transporter